MKLDTSALESHRLLIGASNELQNGFSTAPSFEIPKTTDVSMILLRGLLTSSGHWLTT